MSFNYQQSLDEIFRTYMAVKPLVKHKFDREFRKPQIVLNMARDLGVFPNRERTVRVTGSKGKGTTTRFIAAALQGCELSGRVGMLVSPEETDHVDRMRIDGREISRERFAQIFSRLWPTLREREARFEPGEYLSPSGLFLLIALQWFHEEGVHWFVLEGGRGARWDEVGNIPSRVSVVTSIFAEHLDCLGPTVSDVAAEKLAVGENSDWVVLGESALKWNRDLGLIEGSRLLSVEGVGGAHDCDVPSWIGVNGLLARRALDGLFSAGDVCERHLPAFVSTPSFGRFSLGKVEGVYECLISTESLDAQFYKGLVKRHDGRVVVVASLPDDKDLFGLVRFFGQEIGVRVLHVPLEGTRGYLDYDVTKERFGDCLLASVGTADAAALRDIISGLAEILPQHHVIAVGTQSFIRLLRRSLAE